MSRDHFKGRDAITHVAAAQAQGIITSSEMHGVEIPGSISAGADASREMTMGLLLLSLFLKACTLSHSQIIGLSLLFTFSWAIWKAGRSAWLGWSRLERLHRIIAEERWEIEHNRDQEREELTVLYAAKGLQGQLLVDVIDVLMADEDRLLQVMAQEELGLSLETAEHPLKQGLGAAIGGSISGLIVIAFYLIWPSFGFFIGTLLNLSIGAAVSAYYEGNRLIPAIVWNLALGSLTFGTTFFLFEFFSKQGWLS